MLSSFEELYRTTASSWSKELAAEKVKVGPDQTFEQGLFQRTALATIQQSGVRVVIVLASKEDTATIAVGAQQSGMMAAGWAWAGVDTVPIVQGEAKQALDGWLYFVLAQNVSLERFHEDVRAYGERYFDQSPDSISVYAASLYDAVFLFAHAATRVISEGSDVDDGSAIVEAMTKTSFEGILQRSVELDENGDAIEPYAVMNYVEQGDGNMRGVEVGVYGSGQLDLRVDEVRWPGNASVVPLDGIQQEPCRAGEYYNKSIGHCDNCSAGFFTGRENHDLEKCLSCGDQEDRSSARQS